MNENDRQAKARAQADRVAWAIMWFLITVFGTLITMGVIGFARWVF